MKSGVSCSWFIIDEVKNMVSWSDVKESTARYATISNVLDLLKVGFPEDDRKVAPVNCTSWMECLC